MSSPILFVIGDDRVIHYTGADDVTGDAEDMMSAYFRPHLMFNFGYLIEFVCLKIDLIRISYN